MDEDGNTITINATHVGVVTCRAVNNIGFDEENTTINVLGKTTFCCI